jgi:hypothetical protein
MGVLCIYCDTVKDPSEIIMYAQESRHGDTIMLDYWVGCYSCLQIKHEVENKKKEFDKPRWTIRRYMKRFRKLE